METKALTPLQTKLLEMLKWFDGFCRENGLTYYAIGGTLLGAVRHQGFIPWDDDIDVGMPRNDYEKLAKLMGNNIFEHYCLETQNSDKEDYCYPYSKLYDVGTTLIEHYKTPLIRGVFLDIFPLDGLGPDKNAGLAWFRKINRQYHFYLTRVAAERKGRSGYKNMAIRLSQMIPQFLIHNTRLRKSLDEMCRKYAYDASQWGGNLVGNWGIREIMPLKMFGSPKEYDFEDVKIYGPEDYDGYLTNLYGNWRQLPPVEKQISHHDFISLDLEKSYLGD